MNEPANPLNIRMKFRSGPLAVRAALAQVLVELEPLGLAQEDLGTVEIVLAEALNNIVEHAYPEDETPGPIEVLCKSDAECLNVRIVDDGYPMPGGHAPVGKEANIDADLADLPEGGFGWFLIHSLAKDVDYCRSQNQNILNLRLPVTQPQPRPV